MLRSVTIGDGTIETDDINTTGKVAGDGCSAFKLVVMMVLTNYVVSLALKFEIEMFAICYSSGTFPRHLFLYSLPNAATHRVRVILRRQSKMNCSYFSLAERQTAS